MIDLEDLEADLEDHEVVPEHFESRVDVLYEYCHEILDGQGRVDLLLHELAVAAQVFAGIVWSSWAEGDVETIRLEWHSQLLSQRVAVPMLPNEHSARSAFAGEFERCWLWIRHRMLSS